MSRSELVSIAKIVYRYPLSWEEQDFRTYAALADVAGLATIKIVAKSPDRTWHHESRGSLQVTLVPLRLPAPLDVLEFAALAGFAARRRLSTGAVAQCSEPLGSGLAVLIATAFKGVPTVAHLQGELLDLPGSVGRLRSRMMGALARQVLRRMDAVRCISRPALEQAAAVGVDPSRLHLVPPRCDTARFDPQRFELAAPRPSDEQVIVFVGSLTIHKGIGFLLHAVAALQEQKRVRCVLYGDGPERAALEALAARLDIADAVEFAGRIDHDRVPEAMFAADVMALPSLNEGTPRVVLEAMALGLPVVATSVGGIPDVLVPDAGALVPPGDAPALARALASILDDPAARARCRGLRQVVVEQYGFEAGIERYADLLRRASERRSGALRLNMRPLKVSSGSAQHKADGIVAAFAGEWSGSLLDVGCRSREMQKALASRNISYTGVDIGGGGDVVADLGRGLPFSDRSFDLVLALDVLEHTDDFHFAFRELCRVSRREVVISLPNAYDIGHRFRLLRGKPLGGKYGLPVSRPTDRHRWFFSMNEARAFCTHHAGALGWEVAEERFVVGPNKATGLRRRIVEARPNLLSSTYVAVMRRSDAFDRAVST